MREHCGIGRGLQRSFCRVGSRSLFKKRCASLPTYRPGWSTCKVGYICERTQTRALSGGGVSMTRAEHGCQQRLGDHVQGEFGRFERQPAMRCQIYGILEATTSDSRRELTWSLTPPPSRNFVPLTLQSGVGSRCPPVRAVVRAVTATKHEPGLSPVNRVVLYSSALEAWAVLVRLSQTQYLRWYRFREPPGPAGFQW